MVLHEAWRKRRALTRFGSPHLNGISCFCKGHLQCDGLQNLILFLMLMGLFSFHCGGSCFCMACEFISPSCVPLLYLL